MKKPLQLWVLLAITALETLALTVAGIFYVFETITGHVRYLPTMIALTVMIFGCAVWVAATTRGLAKTQPWARSSSVFIQTALLAIAYYSFQGETARPDIGWALIVPAAISLALLFTKPLTGMFQREL